MILFHAKRDGTVTTTPNFVPQGSSMQDLVVVSEFDYAYCAIKLLPASGEYIEDVPCTPIPQKDFSTIFTAALPPKATVVAGSVDYQLIFTAADGTTQTTLVGSFTVPRGVPVSTPGSAEELAVKTIGDIYKIMDNTYGLFVGHEGNIYKNTEDIAALKEKITTAGTVTIHTTQWSRTTPHTAYMGFPSNTVKKGQAVLFMPLSNATKEAAAKARLSVGVDDVTDGGGNFTDYVPFVQAEEGAVPAVDLDLGYIVLRTAGDFDPMVALIGVDAYGSTADGVNEEAVRNLIKDVVPSWAREDKAPVTSVNGRKGAVTLTAQDVDADPANTAKTLVDDLARQTARDLANYYTKSQTFTKDEINALVSAIPKFKIEVVTSLPTSNISETTVYLVKSWADSSNLYTEYIRANGAWERLGTQTVDLTGYATEAWVNTLLAAYVKTADMEAYVAGLLKAYQPAGDYLTPDTGDQRYAKHTDIPTVPTKLPNPNPLTINGKTYDGSSPVEVTVEGVEGAADTVDIYLNDEDVAVVGHEYNLYHYAIVHGKKPYTEYDIAVTLTYTNDSGGKSYQAANNYAECFRFTPTEERDYTLTYIVRDIKSVGTVYAEKTITLHVIEDTAVSGKKVLFIGDSFTDAGVWPAELQHNLSHGGIVSVGTVSDTVTIGDKSLTVLHEGREGWATWDYAGTNADLMGKFPTASNVFRNPDTNKFDLGYYMETYHPGVTLNAVCVFLGTNGLGAVDSTSAGMTELITRIREYDATLPILLHYTLQNVDQDYWSKFADQKNSTKWYRQHLWRQQYERYKSLYSGMENVYIVPVYENLDYDLDFPKKDFPASARNPATISRVTDGHPDKVGYLKMADVYYAYLLKYMREGGEVEEPDDPDEPDEPTVINLADPSKVAPSGATPSIADDYWWSGYNISNKAITSRADIVVTNKIPVTKNQRIRIKGFQTEGNASGSTARGMFRVLYCDATGNALLTEVQPATSKTAAGTGKLEEMDQDELANGVYCWSPAESSSTSAYLNNLAYIRVCGAPLDGDVRNIIITVDEQIE